MAVNGFQPPGPFLQHEAPFSTGGDSPNPPPPRCCLPHSPDVKCQDSYRRCEAGQWPGGPQRHERWSSGLASAEPRRRPTALREKRRRARAGSGSKWKPRSLLSGHSLLLSSPLCLFALWGLACARLVQDPGCGVSLTQPGVTTFVGFHRMFTDVLPGPCAEPYHLTAGTKASAVGRRPGVAGTDAKSMEQCMQPVSLELSPRLSIPGRCQGRAGPVAPARPLRSFQNLSPRAAWCQSQPAGCHGNPNDY